MSGRTSRCPNHPDRLAVGICNDCGESLCGECLHVYTLNIEGARVILYLCPTCLRKRHAEKANTAIYLGIFFLLFGIFSALILVSLGILIIIMGIGLIIYGGSKKAETPKKSTINDLRVEKEKREAELSTAEKIDTEEIYNKLLTQYADRWGVQTGIELLRSEIMAYTAHGVSFPEAVNRVYQRQEKKTS
jgi:hypothetical protein